MILLLFFVFAAALLQPMVGVASYSDIRISLPHIYEATFVASLSLLLSSVVCFPTSLWWCPLILLIGSVVAIRWQFYVDDKQWMQWATMDLSRTLLYTATAMNKTKVDRVRAMAFKQATAAEDTIKLLRFQAKTEDVIGKK
jgi:hypothetical protein